MLHEILEQIRQSIQKLTTLVEEMKQLSSTIRLLEKLLYDEFRTHYISEMVIFFPQFSLKGLQCRKCTQNKLCWRGQTQGYICGMYFMSHHPEMQGRRLYLAKMHMDQEWLQDFIANAPFRDLILMCSISQANLRILSRITNYGLRFLLHNIYNEKLSHYVLTAEYFTSILLPYFNQQGRDQPISKEK